MSLIVVVVLLSSLSYGVESKKFSNADKFHEALDLTKYSYAKKLKKITETKQHDEKTELIYEENNKTYDLKLINFGKMSGNTTDNDILNALSEDEQKKEGANLASAPIDRIVLKKHKPDKILKIIKGNDLVRLNY